MYPRRDMMMEVALMHFWGKCDSLVRRGEPEHTVAWPGSTERAR